MAPLDNGAVSATPGLVLSWGRWCPGWSRSVAGTNVLMQRMLCVVPGLTEACQVYRDACVFAASMLPCHVSRFVNMAEVKVTSLMCRL